MSWRRGALSAVVLAVVLAVVFTAHDFMFGYPDEKSEAAVLRVVLALLLALAVWTVAPIETPPRGDGWIDLVRHALLRAVVAGVVAALAKLAAMTLRSWLVDHELPQLEYTIMRVSAAGHYAILAFAAVLIELRATRERTVRRDLLLLAVLAVGLVPLHFVGLAQYNYTREVLEHGSLAAGLGALVSFAKSVHESPLYFLDGAFVTASSFAAVVVVRLRRRDGFVEAGAVVLLVWALGLVLEGVSPGIADYLGRPLDQYRWTRTHSFVFDAGAFALGLRTFGRIWPEKRDEE